MDTANPRSDKDRQGTFNVEGSELDLSRRTNSRQGRSGGTNKPTEQLALSDQEARPDRANGPIDPFELFCAYHLGITPSGLYRATNLTDVAKRFGVTPDDINQTLMEHGMHLDALRLSSFDLSLAQMDIQVSPPGVSKTELAKGLFQEFLQARSESSDVQAEAWDPEPTLSDPD